MLIDAHCHLQAEEFDADRDSVLQRCRERGMICVVVGNQLEDSQKAVELAESHEGIFATVGLHPMFVAEEEFDEAAMARLLEHPRVVAVGEIGLDYYRLWADSPEEERKAKHAQQALLHRQLDLARRFQKPVVLHCRDAYEDLLKSIRDYADVPMMLHTFLGEASVAEQFLAAGLFLSFSGIVTFEDEEPLIETVKAVPLERMMIETDAPHLSPVPLRRKRNEPVFIEATAKKIADLKGISVEAVIDQSSRNAKAFFRLP